jgi:hypothetical protein
VTTGGVATLMTGAIAAGTAPVSMASNGSVIMVTTGGADGYFINPSLNLVSAITDGDFLGGGDVGGSDEDFRDACCTVLLFSTV